MTLLQIWVLLQLILFYAIFIGRSITLPLIYGINPFSLGKGKKGWQRLMELFLLVGLMDWTWEVVNEIFGWGVTILPEIFYVELFDFWLLDAAGSGLLLTGNLIFAWALHSFGTSWRIGIDHQSPGTLVTSGVFGKSRNPIFIAFDGIFLGVALIYGNLFFVIAFLLTAAGIHYQILQEERFLNQRHGTAYVEYCQRVRRYF